MKIHLSIAIILFFAIKSNASIPNAHPGDRLTQQIITFIYNYPTLATIKIKDIEKKLERKLMLKEKISFKIVQWKIKKKINSPKEETKKDKGKTAFILGLIGAIAFFVPFINLASIPLAILAIIIGSKAKKEDPSNKKAPTGVTIGIITLAAVLVLGVIVALLIAFGTIG